MSAGPIVFINPPLVLLRADPFTTGIPYMPVSLAYAVAAVRAAGERVAVIDAFGEEPLQYRLDGPFMIRGLTPAQVAARIPDDAEALVLYAGALTNHRGLQELLRTLARVRPSVPRIVMENTQAVTAYSLRQLLGPLLADGATHVLCGEAEQRLPALLAHLRTGTPPADLDGIGWRDADGEHFTAPTRQIADLDALPWPAWELFPLERYWDLRYAHGPLERRRYLPVLTSRGCPYSCRFCVIPETNAVKWRARSARSVVDEIAHWRGLLDVTEFHVEDVDPTINDSRTQALCQELIARDVDVIWKLAAGTKVESIKSDETIALMARAGCRYISISPESGSAEVMRRINKPFDLEHAVRVVRAMTRHGIRSQACFVLGFPGETPADRELTRQMVRRLVEQGVDEIAQFIITPVPGSQIFDQFSGFSDFSQLNFTPTWRQDFAELARFRLRLYASFLWWKLRYHPMKLFSQPFAFVTRRFRTKMEMVPYRALHTMLMAAGFIGRRVVATEALGHDSTAGRGFVSGTSKAPSRTIIAGEVSRARQGPEAPSGHGVALGSPYATSEATSSSEAGPRRGPASGDANEAPDSDRIVANPLRSN